MSKFRSGRRSAIALVVAGLLLSTVEASAFGQSAEASPLTAQQLQAEASNTSVPLQRRIDDQLKLAPGGRQITANEIAWDNGGVIMSFPATGSSVAPPSSQVALRLQMAGHSRASATKVTPSSIHGCPTVTFGNDYYCFYADINWGGRRLQWSDAYKWPNWVRFSNYGFTHQASSWVNGGGKTIWVVEENGCGSGCLASLWTEAAHSSSSYVGDSFNDLADGFYTS